MISTPSSRSSARTRSLGRSLRRVAGVSLVCLVPFLVPGNGAARPTPDQWGLTDADSAYLATNKVIRKCVDPHWMPLEGIDASGHHIGLIADVLDIIEQRLDLRFELVPTDNYVQSMAALEAGACDLVTSDTSEGDEPPYLRKTIPYLDLRNVYITRENEPMQLNFAEIKHRTIGIPAGYPTIPLIRQVYGDVNIVTVDSVEDGLLRVSRGDLYAFTDFLPVCSYGIQRLGLTNLKIAGHLDISFPTSMAVRADKPELLRILNQSLAAIDQDRINSLLVKWVELEYDMKMDWREALPFIPFVLALFALVLYSNHKLKRLNRQLDQANAELVRLTKTDPLTQLKNRHFLDHVLPDLILLACRQELPLGIALLDLDHFKKLNDCYGHAVGDQCLILFAEVLRANFQRESDWLIRYGGEEFLVVCAGIDAEKFTEALEACRRQAEAEPLITTTGETVSYTVSIGYSHHAKCIARWNEAAITEADQHLYQAKAQGRNRVIGRAHLD